MYTAGCLRLQRQATQRELQRAQGSSPIAWDGRPHMYSMVLMTSKTGMAGQSYMQRLDLLCSGVDVHQFRRLYTSQRAKRVQRWLSTACFDTV